MAEPQLPAEPVHRVAALNTNALGRPMMPFAQNLYVVVMCQACDESMGLAGPIGEARGSFSITPRGYAVPFACPKCKRRLGVMLCDPDRPLLEIPRFPGGEE